MSQRRERLVDETSRIDSANRCGVQNGHVYDTPPPPAAQSHSASFTLPINDCYRLSGDERSWRIERRKGGKWCSVEWHSTIEGAVNSLRRRLVRASEVRILPDPALAAVENVAHTLRDAVEPHYCLEGGV